MTADDADAALAALHARYDHDVTCCVHVHNRLHQLRATLPANLALVRRTPRTGIALLDYGSQDGMHDWVRESFRDDLARGTLLYARDSSVRFFHASKSKNLAHRLGPGKLLLNLDADNFLDDSLPVLRQLGAASDRLLVHMWSGVWEDGTYGRIAISRALFAELRGYDESFLPVGYQDTDLIERARVVGADVVTIHGGTFAAGSGLRVRAIANPISEKLRFTGSTMRFSLMDRLNRLRARVNGRLLGPRRNPGGWGGARVEINFETELELA